ncbi:MAG: GNAT family N-acetyltransferase [Pseudohongiella sp.]|nr:GNAT family N-acetyltransferase [Pseudohongiella sp.]
MAKTSDKNRRPSAVEDCAEVVNESWQRRAGGPADNRQQLLPVRREFRETDYGTEAYKRTLELRHRVLREPLGLNLWNENLSVEVNQRHFSIWSVDQKTDTLLACVVIVPLAAGCVKLRQMAVDASYQRQRLGQQLITEVEKIMSSEGARLIELHARVSAESFYKACGYQSVGGIFTEVGIKHRCMTKIINPAS